MTERRPHWDDDLIKAVGDAIERADSAFYPTVGMVNDVIAAVEDWQVANARDRVYLAEPTSAEQAAIARVRELHGRHDPNCPYGQDCAGAGLCLACREEYPCATIRALDGSNSPPVTSEITGPLIDPDCRDGKHSSCVGGPCDCECHNIIPRGESTDDSL